MTHSEDTRHKPEQLDLIAPPAQPVQLSLTATRAAAIPEWYWQHYPGQRELVEAGDTELLEYIEERIEDWHTDPLP